MPLPSIREINIVFNQGLFCLKYNTLLHVQYNTLYTPKRTYEESVGEIFFYAVKQVS